MTWVYVAVGIVCLIVLQAIRAALSMEFSRYSARPIPRPSDVEFGGLDLIDARTPELHELGFEGPEWIGGDPSNDSSTKVAAHAVYQNLSRGIVVWLGPTIDISQPNQLLIYYTTQLQDGRFAVTQVSDPYFETVDDPATPAQTIAASSIGIEVEKHEQFVESLGVSRADTARKFDAVQFAESHMNAIRERLLKRNWIKEVDGVARPGWAFAFRLLQKLRSRPKPAAPENDPLPPHRLAFLADVVKVVQSRAPSQANQWALLLFSGALSLFIGWPFFGLETTLVILVVIGFHEFGHWVAMKMAGYQNPHITLLPLLGGVTIGYETDPSATTRAWVALAGPLPGIILGWTLLIFWQTEFHTAEWLFPAIIVLLFINYLNVLPIPPLDGSHILRAVLPPRWIAVQIVVLVTGVAIGIYVAAALDFWPLALIAALHLLGLKSMWATAKQTHYFATSPAPRGLDEKGRMAWLLDKLEERLGPATDANKRIATATRIDTQVNMIPMRALQRGAVSVVYAALLVVPILALIISVEVSSMGLGVEEYDQMYEQVDEEIAAARIEVQDMDLQSLIAAVVADDSRVSDANSGTIADAESRLGRPLPSTLIEFYRITDGAPDSTGIGPLSDIRKVDPELFKSGALSEFAYDGNLYFFGADYEDIVVPVAVTHDWWLLGSNIESYSYVFLDPDNVDDGPMIYSIGEYGISAHASVRAFLEDLWVNELTNAIYEERYTEIQAAALSDMKDLEVEELLDRLPKPSLLDRLISQRFFAPRAAGDAAILAAESRVGFGLHEDYRAFLKIQNGSSDLGLLPVESIQPATRAAEPITDAAIDIAHNNDAPDFDIESLHQCWIIASRGDFGNASDSSRTMGAQLFWCPEQEAEQQYLSLTHAKFLPTFTDAIREHAAMMILY